MKRLEPVHIDVAASIIADISSGIYRTPANALKELISNSFDADATEVFINTGYSNFDVFTCNDNGRGMPVDDFIWYMQHIGGSVKRTDSGITKFGRPIIGKLGIGVLAVSQICREFTVISSAGHGKKFEASIDLTEFEEKEAAKKHLGRDKEGIVRIGEFEPVVYDEEKGKSYTQIILNEIDEGYRVSLTRGFNLPFFKKRVANPEGFFDFVKEVASVRRGLGQFSEYDRLIWELALVTPVKYLQNGPIIDEKCIPQIIDRLNSYKFKVIVDGLELRKPISFPLDPEVSRKRVDYDFVPIGYNQIVSGLPKERARLKLEGYIYFQRKAIIPPEMRGILIRIRNVAIGYYDKSLLHFPLPIGPLANQVSGEIYVKEGLETALNIDRNSFRETDLHYIELQNSIFGALAGTEEQRRQWKEKKVRETKLPVFDKIRLYSKRRREEEAKHYEEEYLHYLRNVLKRALKQDFSIEAINRVGDRPLIIKDMNKITIFAKNPLWPRKRLELNAFRKLLIFKEVSEASSTSVESARRVFFELLKATRK